MAQPQIESFTISDDGITITAKYDQILYGKGTFVNYPLISTPSDYSAVYYSWTLTAEEFFAGFDTLTFVSYTNFSGSENRGLPVYAPTNPNLVTSLTTNFQVTDVVNSQGEAPVNVTSLVLDTSNTPAATGINPPYDVLDTYNKKVRKQASRDKILCVYNTAAVYGIYDEPLIDAYFDEYGITNHIKVGIDFSIAANTDKRWWTSWGLDVYNQVIDNGIEQICCGPLGPTAMSKGFNSSIQVDLSNCLGSLKLIKAELEQRNLSGLEEMQIPCGETFYNQDGSNPRNSRVGYYQFSPDLNAGEATGLTGMGIGYTKGSFRANLGGLDTETFSGLLGFSTSIQVPGLHFDQYEPSDLFWSTIAKPYQSRTIRMPCWRIGYFPYAQKPFLPTTTIIRQMVKNSKAAAMPTARNKEEKVLLTNTFFTTPLLKACTDSVYLSHLWESLGYTKSFFGATNKPQVISDLENVSGTVVGDTGLTKYEWQGLNPPATGAIDYIGEIQVTPQADDATNVYLDSIWMEQWDGNGAIGPGMAYRAKSTGTTFPILADIIVDQTRNFNGNYDGSIRNALQCKPGGIRFNATSHGQRGGIWDLAYGASASVASLHEPQAPAVLSYPQMISELLRGHTIAAAHIFTNTNICTSSSVWGDGLLQPYYEQAQEDQTMKVLKRSIYGKAVPGATGYYLSNSKGIGLGKGVINTTYGNAPVPMFETYVWPVFPAKIIAQGTGYVSQFTAPGVGGSGTGFSLAGQNIVNGGYTNFSMMSSSSAGVGYALGDQLEFFDIQAPAASGFKIEFTTGPVSINFVTASSSPNTAITQDQVTINVVAGDDIEDICDKFVAEIATYQSNTAKAGYHYYVTKVQGTNGERNGRYGLKITGRQPAWGFRQGVGVVNTSVIYPATGVQFDTKLANQDFVAGQNNPTKESWTAISYTDFQRDINDNPIYSHRFINATQADGAVIGHTFPTGGSFILYHNGVTSAEIAFVNTLVGKQPAVLKITFKNVSRPDRADVVINGTDLTPWQNVANVAVLATLNSNSGTAGRILPLFDGDRYEVTTEFTAANLGITSGGGSEASKSVISQSVISHNTES
jgi:hypothetical protein